MLSYSYKPVSYMLYMHSDLATFTAQVLVNCTVPPEIWNTL